MLCLEECPRTTVPSQQKYRGGNLWAMAISKETAIRTFSLTPQNIAQLYAGIVIFTLKLPVTKDIPTGTH